MLIYAILICIIVIFCLWNRCVAEKYKLLDNSCIRYKIVSSKAYDIFITKGLLLILVICIISAVRHVEVGTDVAASYYPYYNHFKNSSGAFLYPMFNFEIGFKIFTYIFAICKLPFQIYLTFISCFFWITVWFIVDKFSKDKNLSILVVVAIGLLEHSFSALRQILALSIFLWAIYFLLQKKPYLYVLFVIIASLFHTSAIFLLVFLVFYYLPINKKTLIVVSSISAVLILLMKPIMLLIELLFEIDYFSRYISIGSISILNWFVLIFMIIFFVLSIHILMKTNKTNSFINNNSFFIWMFFFVILFKLIALIYGIPIAGRMLLYVYYSLAFLIPECFSNIQKSYRFRNNTIYIYIAIIIMIVFYFVFNLVTKDLCDIVPYRFFKF